jgi:hypothetical protein
MSAPEHRAGESSIESVRVVAEQRASQWSSAPSSIFDDMQRALEESFSPEPPRCMTQGEYETLVKVARSNGIAVPDLVDGCLIGVRVLGG